MLTPDADLLLGQVRKSPAAVAIHDKKAWMSIFAQYHIVEDPVGSKPHIGGIYDEASGQRGNGPLARFFDTFIAPNKIAFDVRRDIVCLNHVVRDLMINIEMSDKIRVQVPMHAIYELGLENGEWKIIRLAAHWELMPMIQQLLGKGTACLGVLADLTVRMFRLQGVSGMLGFAKGAFTVGKPGKRIAEQFVKSFNAKNLSGLMEVCASDNPVIHMPYGAIPVSPSQLFGRVNGEISLSKVMASGDTVTASMSFKEGDAVKEGVAVFEFNRQVQKIAQLRCYF